MKINKILIEAPEERSNIRKSANELERSGLKISSYAEAEKELKEVEGSPTKQADIFEEIFKNIMPGGKIDNPETLRQEMGDLTFVDWAKAFNLKEIFDPQNPFRVLLSYIDNNDLGSLLKDKNFYKLYNAYVNEALDNITIRYAQGLKSKGLPPIIFNKSLYDQDQDSINYLIKFDLSNKDPYIKAKALYDEKNIKNITSNSKIRDARDVNRLLKSSGNFSDDDDTLESENIIIKNGDASKLNQKQKQTIVNSIASTDEGKRLIRDAVNGN